MHTLEQLRSGALAGTRRLDLACGLTTLPPEVLDLADTLEVLNLSGNALRDLPADLPRLRHLKVIFCSNNAFTHLPEVLGDCPALEMVGFKSNRIAQVSPAALPMALRWLILTDNRLSHLPDAVGERAALQKLMLAGNQLAALPESLRQAKRLELIRLSANQLAHVPGWLTELPALAWVALAGNPWQGAAGAGSGAGVPADAVAGRTAQQVGPSDLLTLSLSSTPGPSTCPTVPWSALEVGNKLGEGASGHIYAARLTHPSGLAAGAQALADVPLALKLFKGSVTSDGLPGDELAASLHAGQHPALITPLAQVADHPQGCHAVLLPRLPAQAVNLAAPPSLTSCTRDVYAPQLALPEAVCRTLVHTLADAVAHLHAHGVLHGDLYAHNILWQPATGEAWLGDFGAATVLQVQSTGVQRADVRALAARLLALEVRAFGILLQELAERCTPATGSHWPDQLMVLAQAYMQPDVGERPLMPEVCEVLQKI